jgi:hypothetical protein
MRLMPAAAIVFTLACAARSGTQTRTPAKSSPAPAAPPPAARAERTESDEYTRYELLDPETAQFHILYEATAIAPGATVFFNTDEKSYRLDGDELVFDRSFGRPHNAVVLPAGWYLTACAIPVAVSQMPAGRIRLDFVNPRPDEIAVLIKAKRRPSSPSPRAGVREGSPLALLSAGRDRRSRPLAKRAAGRAG